MSMDSEPYLLATLGRNGTVVSGGSGSKFGYAVSNAGDFNADGLDDVIMTAPEAGRVYILKGKSVQSTEDGVSFPENIDATEGGSHLITISGAENGEKLGLHLAFNFDINGDNQKDIAISSDKAVYVLFGGANVGDQISVADLTGKGFKYTPETSNPTGFALSNVRNFNGDGVDDLAIGNTEGPHVVVLYGDASAADFPQNIGQVTGGKGLKISGAGGSFGYSLGGSFDLDKDGFDDIVVGDVENDAVFVVYGGSSYADILDGMPSENVLRYGDVEGTEFGTSVSRAGDMNGDGIDDIIVGAPGGSSGKGFAYWILGQDGVRGFAGLEDLKDIPVNNLGQENVLRFVGLSYSRSGASVASIGDFNGDGKEDVIVSAAGESGKPGSAYVLFGTTDDFAFGLAARQLQAYQGFPIVGPTDDDLVGFSVGGGFDCNGDDVDDLVLGGPGTAEGKAYVYLGVHKIEKLPTAHPTTVHPTRAPSPAPISGGPVGAPSEDGPAGETTSSQNQIMMQVALFFVLLAFLI